MLCIFYFYNVDFAESKYLLDIESYFNPDSVGVGDKGNLAISIKNLGNATTIQSISFTSPNWPFTLTSVTPETFILNRSSLGSNRSLFVNIEVDINQTAPGGTYTTEAVVSTPDSDYIVPSKLTVNRLESVPFSGNIPLSILVLAFAGIITYGIMIYIVTHKFDRSYIEMGLVSIGFGFLNWGIAYSLNLVNIIERIHYEPLGILILFEISALLGLGLGYLIKGIQAFKSWRVRNREQLQSIRKGYGIDEQKSWATYIRQEWDEVKKSYGKRYSLTLRIHLKFSLNKVPFVDGILLRLEFQSPYDIILEPKYVVSCSSRSQLLNILTDKNAPLILENLQSDNTYRKNVIKYLIQKQGSTSINKKSNAIDVQNELILQLNKKLKSDDYFSLINAIDMSLYGGKVVKALLEKHNEKLICEYGERVFIPGDNIARVEIIKNEPFYGIAFFENGKTRIIPPVYEGAEQPYRKDVTADA